MIRCVTEPRLSLWRRLLALLDDALPMPPDQRAARDEDGRDHSPYRKRRLRLHMLEKRGKGGFR
jgi:hypothetical protein